ncbi:MAG: hypothetical protein ACYC1C_12675 [Chloroflexota bacterium]
MLREAISGLILAALLGLSACTGGGAQAGPQPQPSPAAPTISAGEALRAALASDQARGTRIHFADFPTEPGSKPCEIRGGGPQPPPGGKGFYVDGECSATATPNDSRWLVTLEVAWDASQFHHEGEPVTGNLTHTWQFKVDEAGQVVAETEAGYFPPNYVH